MVLNVCPMYYPVDIMKKANLPFFIITATYLGAVHNKVYVHV